MGDALYNYRLIHFTKLPAKTVIRRIWGIFSLFTVFIFPSKLPAQVIFSSVRSADSSRRETTHSITYLEVSASIFSKASGTTTPSSEASVVSSLAIPKSLVISAATDAYLEQLVDSLQAINVEKTRRPARRSASARTSKESGEQWIERLRGIPAIFPFRLSTLSEFRISSAFGLRYHPVLGVVRNHAGIDLPRRKGEAVYATADGIVSQVSSQPNGLGLAVYLRHKDDFETIYGHLSNYRVEPGETVRRGQIIGQVGQTGLATGPHLHYSVIHRGVALNPERFCYLLLRKLGTLSSTHR